MRTIQNFEDTRKANRDKYLWKRSQNHRSIWRTEQLKKKWDLEDRIRADKRRRRR